MPSLGNFIGEFFQNFREQIKLTFFKIFQSTEASGSGQLEPYHTCMRLLGTRVDKPQQGEVHYKQSQQVCYLGKHQMELETSDNRSSAGLFWDLL